jgi:outer membrane receptor protein involved in Fe transport
MKRSKSAATAARAMKGLICAVPALVLGMGTAAAQDDATEGLLQEVVVTAQKRAERLFDVPISVAAFLGRGPGKVSGQRHP